MYTLKKHLSTKHKSIQEKKMSIKKTIKNISFLFCPIIFIACISILSMIKGVGVKNCDSTISLHSQTENITTCQEVSPKPIDDFKAVWVPFMDVDMKSECSKETFEQKIENIISDCKKYKLNTIIFHVRSHSDAIYPSEIFPWSHLLTGVQGRSPKFDPLSMIIKKVHEENIKFHAWINPFRIQSSSVPRHIDNENPAIKLQNEKNCVLKLGNDIYYNPANEKVQKLILDGIKEVVQNYDVDAIHLDDRFYPTEDVNFDKDSYNEYLSNLKSENEVMDVFKWRQNNINNLISNVYKEIKNINSNVLLGISPEGNVENAQKHGLDVKKWCSEKGYVDYICPQLYWSLDNPTLNFKTAANQWKNIVTLNDIALYFGLCLYKIGTNLDSNTWSLHNNDIIKQEINYSKNIDVNGFALYPYNCLNKPEVEKELLNMSEVLT